MIAVVPGHRQCRRTTPSACVSTIFRSRRTRSRRPWHDHCHARVVAHRQWQGGGSGRGAGNDDDDRFPPRVSEPHRLAPGLRHRGLPCMHGHPRSSDGRSEEWRTCITGAHFFAGKSVRTIEGHAQRDAQGEVVKLTPGAAGIHRAFRLSMRLLHAGLRHRRDGTARGAQAQARRTRRISSASFTQRSTGISAAAPATSATTKRFARSCWRRRVW